MPVYKLTPTHKKIIINRAVSLANRRKNLELALCPIDVHMLVKLLNEPEALAHAEAALKAGYAVCTTHDITLRVNAKALNVNPEIVPKFMVFAIKTKTAFFTQKKDLWNGVEDKFTPSWDEELFDQATREKIAAWVTKVHLRCREAMLVRSTVNTAMDTFDHTGHLMANWPDLIGLVMNTQGENYYKSKDFMKLKERLQVPTRRTYMYKRSWPTGGNYELMDKLLIAAQRIMVSNMMLDSKFSAREPTIESITATRFEIAPDAPWYLRGEP